MTEISDINQSFSSPLEAFFNNKCDKTVILVLISMRTYYLYLLECFDGSYYVGITNDICQRIQEHQQGFDPGCYTYSRRPVSLKYYMTFNYIDEAIYFEKKIKKYSRAKKVAFFKKDWKTMHEKAKCKNSSFYLNNNKKRSSGDETS